MTPAVYDTEPSAFGLRKKAKEEWRCAVCQLSVTSESQLNEHQRGKQHKAKEAALKTQMIGESTEAYLSSKESETRTEKAGEVNSLATREEVRKELVLGIPMQRCLVAPASSQERVTKCSVPIMNPLLVDDIIDVSQAHPPKIVAPVEINRSSEIDKDKVIMLVSLNSSFVYLFSFFFPSISLFLCLFISKLCFLSSLDESHCAWGEKTG